jgi:ribosomal L7/L12-like protein
MGFFDSSFDPALAARLTRIERQLQSLLDHFQIELPDDGLDEVRQLAAAGDKIGAIKLHRQLTGAGLAEAKAFVEGGL